MINRILKSVFCNILKVLEIGCLVFKFFYMELVFVMECFQVGMMCKYKSLFIYNVVMVLNFLKSFEKVNLIVVVFI